MSMADYRGARGANAGDDFHELWALREALMLLDQDTNLIQVTVEGLTAEDESGTSPDTWDGVDCTLYFGDDQAASYERIVIAQLKYSAADSDQTWTVSRLSYSTNKRKDNSVMGRLAKAFINLKTKYPDLVTSGNLVVQLVSNQAVDSAVIKAFSGELEPSSRNPSGRPPERSVLQTASGLSDPDFETFAKALDFSQCGHESRFALEEHILGTISALTESDARAAVNDLLFFIHRKMLPEAKGESITRQSILLWMGVSDPAALFPCPPSIKRVDRVVPRVASEHIVEQILAGNQRICLDGEGGSGKTTALQELRDLLPPGSVVLVFDCYGSGRYLDSNASRHLSKDAFLQLSNDLAVHLRIPLLVSRSENLDYSRVFKKRLERAAEVVASQDPNALLVISIDAADNSIIAANTHAPPERSFVHDFVRLGDLPDNVRFILTCRTGRLDTLELPRVFTQVQITGFSRDETAAHVRGVLADAPDAWIDDFHSLSGGNPRVQQYALDLAGSEPVKALEYLRPNGKMLDQIFRDRFELALSKEGHDRHLKVVCAGLIALPRPIPLADLSAVTGLTEAHVRDICNDLAPGVRIAEQSLSFADEDFEQFVRAEGEAQLLAMYSQIADYFASRHKSDPYAATHIAAALLAAGRGPEIIDLINTNPVPEAIGDPVLRRETQLQRLRIAMKVCREAGNNVDAMWTLLIGAEALKTDAAIRQMLVDNPDLAASFARDIAARAILRDPKKIEKHGPLLFHLMAADARSRDAISVREGRRLLEAWLQARREQQWIEKEKHPNIEPQSWRIHDCDISAETEAILRIQGPQRSLETLLRWSPKSMVLHIASLLSFKLITSGEASLVERYITEAKVGTPWDLFLLIPLALAGNDIDLSRIEVGLGRLLRRGLIDLDHLRKNWNDDNPTVQYLDMIVTACETVVARGGDRACVIPVLERISDRESRRRDRLATWQISPIDFSLRAHALLERLAGRQTTLETYWVDPDEPPGDLPPKKVEEAKRLDNERKQEFQTFIKPIIDIYDVRAQAILGLIKPGEVKNQLQTAITRYYGEEYRFNRQPYASAMRTRAALSITRLMVLPGLDRTVLLECASALLGPNPAASAETEIFASLALDRSLHEQMLRIITARATAVKNMKTSAEEKITALISFARLLLPISYADAQSIFNTTVEVAGEVNVDSIHEIALFAPLAERAVTGMSVEERKAVAFNLAIVVGDTAVRLDDNEHFPWEQAAQALGTLDVCLALAVTARWEDLDIVGREHILPPVLETALLHHEMTPVQVSALSALLNEFSPELTGLIVDEAIGPNSKLDLMSLAEYLAREELLRFGQGIRPQVSEKLALLLKKGGPGFWMDRLAQTTMFRQTTRPIQISPPAKRETTASNDEYKIKQATALESLNWTAYRFVTPDEINDVIVQVQTAALGLNTHVSVATIFDKIGNIIRVGDRAAHLEALSHSKSPNVADHEIPLAIARRVADWRDSPSVANWSKMRLLQVVVDLLPELSRWLPYGESQLPALLEKSGTSDQQICAALLEAMERHVDTLNAPTIYALVGLLARYYTPVDTAQILSRYARRLVDRIPVSERDNWNLADIPSDAAVGIARFLYTLMGDIDIRVRWRAAHALRRLVQLGDVATLDAIIGLYGRKDEACYRNPNVPFYWLSARLWLVIALDRISAEKPVTLARHGQWLLEIAVDDKFPHIIIRLFAKSAVYKLVESRELVLDQSQMDALEKANTSSLPRKKTRQPSYKVGFDRHGYQERESRRFHFNTLDTLPYWYSGALRAFADVSTEEFLDVAEHWIVDHWGVQNNPWRWDDEPRKYRVSDRDSQLMSHGHGSRPILERFHTYLELHAMWCVMGELMQTRALIKAEKDDYDSFEHLLREDGLSLPPFWLADLHAAKPLEARMWFPPQNDVNVWIEAGISVAEFLAEMGLASNDGSIVIESSHDNRSSKFTLSAQVRTALVSPETAGALVRALQTVDDSWSYRIPKNGDDLEIDSPPYQLLGWLAYGEEDLGIDERDPLRYQVGTIQFSPSNKTLKVLNLKFVQDNQTRWVEASQENTVFVYEAWGDTRGDEREDRFSYDETVRSDGWRLKVDKETLRTLLNKLDLDLIVEIETTRRNYSYGYSRYDKEKEKETRFDRVIILRRDGTVETAEGRLGTWTASRP